MKFDKLVESFMNKVYVVFDGTGEFDTPRVYKIFAEKNNAINFVINEILLKKNKSMNPYLKMSKESLVSEAHAYIEDFEVN